jgi:acetylornithine deacetylase
VAIHRGRTAGRRPQGEGVVKVASYLADLVAIPTHHAGVGETQGGNERALCDHLAPLLAARGADEVVVIDAPRHHGGPGAYIYARWGQPTWLVNAHVDTVPANSGWSRDPWTPVIEDGKLYGLGACDTKGAIAATLAALDDVRPSNAAVLFSGDEERGTASVVSFLASPYATGLQRAIVCEPTARRAGIRHRGVLASAATYQGKGGHSSNADTMPKPVVTLARLAVALDELGKRRLGDGPEGMTGLCMNVAALRGGVAFNVVPDAAELVWSIRPPPGFDRDGWEREVAALAAGIDPTIAITRHTDHAPFACRDVAGFQAWLDGAASAWVGLDFWTEAALYEAAGIDAVVIGPGDIRQAHAADEHVTLEDLAWGTDLYRSLFARAR